MQPETIGYFRLLAKLEKVKNQHFGIEFPTPTFPPYKSDPSEFTRPGNSRRSKSGMGIRAGWLHVPAAPLGVGHEKDHSTDQILIGAGLTGIREYAHQFGYAGAEFSDLGGVTIFLNPSDKWFAPALTVLSKATGLAVKVEKVSHVAETTWFVDAFRSLCYGEVIKSVASNGTVVRITPKHPPKLRLCPFFWFFLLRGEEDSRLEFALIAEEHPEIFEAIDRLGKESR